ncbi:hypothetical protein DBV15_10813 [Temnothorax longispinosus]|uniref:Uncharacterized protein n=1 Tax=Temnothorax longispinosus TaxID=300112 RepID=A0A4V3S6S9_9HYME|nr:hypothetical protein DBV15_10813 [Temnothorax longispinosus]
MPRRSLRRKVYPKLHTGVRKGFSRGGEAREDEMGWWSLWRRIGGGRESGEEVKDSVIEEQLHDEGAERVDSMEFRASDRSTCRETEECDGGAAGAERSGESSRRVEGSSNRTSGLAARGGRLSRKFGCGRENKTRKKVAEGLKVNVEVKEISVIEQREKEGCGRESGIRERKIEREGRTIAEAVERIVEKKVRKMLRSPEKKEDDRKKEERMEELEEKVRSLKRKVERMEQSEGKRKREEYEESGTEKKKWVEKEKWGGKESNWEKVKELFAERLKVRVTVRKVIVVRQRGIWMTILVKLENEEEKWRVLEAKRKARNSIGVKIHEDKRKKLQEGWRRNFSWPPMMRRRRMGERETGLNREELRREGGRLKDGVAAETEEEEEG